MTSTRPITLPALPAKTVHELEPDSSRVVQLGHTDAAMEAFATKAIEDDRAASVPPDAESAGLPLGYIAERTALMRLLSDVDSLPLHVHKRAVVRDWISREVASVEELARASIAASSPATPPAAPIPPDVAKMVQALESIQRYGLDTLSGRTDGPDDRDWQRAGVNEMTKRARLALEAHRAAATQARVASEPVAWCELTPNGKIAYFDGKPMFMPGSVGNDCHRTPLYTSPQPSPEPADDPYFGVEDEVYLTRAVSVMNDVLGDISGWEDTALADAVKSSKIDLCAMIECIRMRADSTYVPGSKPIDGEHP